MLVLCIVPYCLHATPVWIVEGADRELKTNLLLYVDDINIADVSTENAAALATPVKSAAQALGYYHLTWKLEQRGDEKIIIVTPGPRVRYRQLDLQLLGAGRNDADLQKFWRKPALEPGQALHHGDYEKFKRQAIETARGAGYLDAHFVQHRIRVDRAANHADVTLHLDTGPVFTIGKVSFEGSQLDRELLDNMMPVKPGEQFRAQSLAQIYGSFYDSGYFTDITITPQPGNATQRDIVVTLKDSAAHRFVTGAGFSTDTGARVRLGWTMPALNKAGHQWQNELRMAQKEQSFTSEYRIPVSNPLEHYVALDAGWRNRDVEDTRTEIFNAGISLNNKKKSGWNSRYGVDFDFEKYRQGSEPVTEVFYTIPNIGWDYRYHEGPERMPDAGYRFWINTDASVPALGADAPFARVMLGAKWLDVFRDYHELSARAEAGAISQSDITQVPASRRFFTGGDQTVRGFSYLALAPEDDAGEAIGGRFLNVASIEYRYRFSDSWHFATFIDSGRAYSDSAAQFHTGAGFGLHWQTLVGPIRFDIARPIDNDEHKAVHLHITMGPTL